MIASNFKSVLFFAIGFKHKILNFPIMSNCPCMGRFSAGELNVI